MPLGYSYNNILCIKDEYAHIYKDDDIRQENITNILLEKYDTIAWVRVNPNKNKKPSKNYDERIQTETQQKRPGLRRTRSAGHSLAKGECSGFILNLVENPESRPAVKYGSTCILFY